MVQQVAGWFQYAQVTVSSSDLHWISFYQLYCDYMLCYGEGGPIKDDKWRDPCDCPPGDLLNLSFKLRCRWFTHLLKELWKSWGCKIHVNYTRPRSEMLILHASCAWIRWPVERTDKIETWLSSMLQGPAKRDGKQLLRLPTAKKDPSMPAIMGEKDIR